MTSWVTNSARPMITASSRSFMNSSSVLLKLEALEGLKASGGVECDGVVDRGRNKVGLNVVLQHGFSDIVGTMMGR